MASEMGFELRRGDQPRGAGLRWSEVRGEEFKEARVVDLSCVSVSAGAGWNGMIVLVVWLFGKQGLLFWRFLALELAEHQR